VPGYTEHTPDVTLWVATCYRNDMKNKSMDEKEEARKKINFCLSWNRLNIVIYSVNKTQHVLVINIKNSATFFGSLGYHQANTKHSTGTFSECTHCGIPYCLQNYIDSKDHISLVDVFKIYIKTPINMSPNF
jgi:hypothetical protein